MTNPDRSEQIRQQASQQAKADLALYQQAYLEQFQALLDSTELFELEKQAVQERYRGRGMELAMLAVKTQQQTFYATIAHLQFGTPLDLPPLPTDTPPADSSAPPAD